MDDDLQNPPSEILRLLERAQSSGKHVIYGRYIDKQHASWRNLGSQFTNWMATLLLIKPEDIYLSSFRCISESIVRHISSYSGPFPYVDGLIMQVTDSIGQIQVEHHPRVVGQSNYTLRRLLRLWLNMFVNFSIMPLRVATLVGIGLSLLGGLALILVAVEVIATRTPPGWGSLMATLLLVSGIQLLILGVFGEYLGRIHMTTSGKPQYIINQIEHNRAWATNKDSSTAAEEHVG